ncbi:histone-lysine N-methyltransferase SETMAR [Nephila pilipes]|uniref:Histone-lysine N-methyltransferase SETMAR n=1 Tax=Nephila pilipes TaxID=299642 RepID=A0A8X6QN08_NEPPI|nr:histone-lysine N-methyltransferase SETMAR [Nephila pilipes]
MSRQQVAKWCRSFQAGREHVENRNMEASGRPSFSRTNINTARVEEIIQRDRRVTVRKIASELDLSYGNVQRIITDELRYSKMRLTKSSSVTDWQLQSRRQPAPVALLLWLQYTLELNRGFML